MKFRKKPVEVEAFKLTADPERIAPDWFTKAVADERIYIDRVMKDGHIDVYGCMIRISPLPGLRRTDHVEAAF